MINGTPVIAAYTDIGRNKNSVGSQPTKATTYTTKDRDNVQMTHIQNIL